jgi:hypothetical protein
MFDIPLTDLPYCIGGSVALNILLILVVIRLRVKLGKYEGAVHGIDKIIDDLEPKPPPPPDPRRRLKTKYYDE